MKRKINVPKEKTFFSPVETVPVEVKSRALVSQNRLQICDSEGDDRITITLSKSSPFVVHINSDGMSENETGDGYRAAMVAVEDFIPRIKELIDEFNRRSDHNEVSETPQDVIGTREISIE